MISELSNKSQVRSSSSATEMRSWRGFWGALLILAMVPLTVLYQQLFQVGQDTFVHWVLAAGTLLVAWSVFDFRRVPLWMQVIGALAAVGLAIIFFLQGLSHVVQSEWLTTLAYGTLAKYPEIWLMRVVIYGWGGALLLTESQGKAKLLGFITLFSVLAAEVYSSGLPFFGITPPAWLRAAYLLPFVWLLVESKKIAERKFQ